MYKSANNVMQTFPSTDMSNFLMNIFQLAELCDRVSGGTQFHGDEEEEKEREAKCQPHSPPVTMFSCTLNHTNLSI